RQRQVSVRPVRALPQLDPDAPAAGQPGGRHEGPAAVLRESRRGGREAHRRRAQVREQDAEGLDREGHEALLGEQGVGDEHVVGSGEFNFYVVYVG
ncbi:hypothetical protein THAOC_20819, partial [Thalassiosira oceanica]